MIKCSNCKAKHPENALFCSECGAYLLGSEQEKTNILIVDKMPWKEREETSEVPGEEAIPPLCLKLTIPDSGRDVEVPLTKEVNIGRLDPTSASFPEVDLISDDGREKGVSRRHAKVTRRGNEILVEDLGSINGTFLNHRRLKPYLPQLLKSGDELQLGKLVLRVGFTW